MLSMAIFLRTLASASLCCNKTRLNSRKAFCFAASPGGAPAAGVAGSSASISPKSLEIDMSAMRQSQ